MFAGIVCEDTNEDGKIKMLLHVELREGGEVVTKFDSFFMS